jgi:predicted MFS family arabinose efflux permease
MVLSRRDAVAVFLAFAFAYFLSALTRAVTATLAPTLTQEFALQARDLGLMAGGYFIGFSLTQLPLGRWLDRHGPRTVVLAFLAVAVVGCAGFALAGSFTALLAARILCGMGLSACLMAPLTGYRRWLTPGMQLRASSWMLMTGSLGMVASTLPVQWLVPLVGWRALFLVMALLIVLAMGLIAWKVPAWPPAAPPAPGAPDASYREVWRHAYFRRMTPVGFFCYGGVLALQTLWAGPWMVRVAGYTPSQAATGLFTINVAMLLAFWGWGLVSPRLAARGWGADRLIAWGQPLSFLGMAWLIAAGSQAGTWSWVLFFVGSTFVALAQPAVGMAFPPALAGRALSAYNLVIFLGVFVVQWGIGLLIDGFQALGLAEGDSFRAALAVLLACCLASWTYFMRARPDNQPQ